MEASKKVYVHYEGKPEYTHVAKITWGLTAEQLAVEFTRVYNAKHGRIVSLDPATIHLLNGRRRMSKSANLIRLVKDRSDIFVEQECPSSAGSGHSIEQNLYSNDEEGNVKLQAASPPETLVKGEPGSGISDQQHESLIEANLASAVKRVLEVGQEVEEPFIHDVLMSALKAQQLKKYKLAGDIFSKVLDVLPKQQICLRGLGSMALTVHNYSGALKWLQCGVAEYPMDAVFHARLADAYSGLGQYKEALVEYDAALGLTVEQKPAEIDNTEGLSSVQTEDLELQQNILERHHCDVQPVDDPTAGDIMGPVTQDGLKISSAAILGKIGQGELANAILTDDPLDSLEQQLIAAADQPLDETVLISMPLLSFGDDLLLLSFTASTETHVQTMDSVSVPAFLPLENKKIKIVVVSSSPQNA